MKKVIIFGGKGNGTVLVSMIEDTPKKKKWIYLDLLMTVKKK